MKENNISIYLPWKQFEREIVKAFKKAGFRDAKRNWSEQFGEESGKDLINTEPYVIQCKYGVRPNLVGAWQEAAGEAKKGEIPVGIARFKNCKGTFVCLSIKDFMWMIKQ